MAVLGVVALMGYFFVLPLLFLFLGVAAWGRDRVSGASSFAAAAALGVEFLANGPPQLWTGMPRLASLLIAGGAVVALIVRLVRDGRHRHRRSTAESLAVLAIGTILLALLLSVPALMSMGQGLGQI